MSLEMEIALIKKDLENGNEIFNRLDKAIDKLSDVLTAMREVTVLQEQRIVYLENGVEDLYTNMERRTDKLDSVKTEFKLEFDERFDKMEKKIDSMMRKIWMFTGGAVVVGYILASMDLVKLFT